MNKIIVYKIFSNNKINKNLKFKINNLKIISKVQFQINKKFKINLTKI